ncbi:MAG: HD-GYP domain-containing protein [Elusimicrobia bacterium]|nr:HD-GYP domain-containing protein [Elusimicrobiota bacterium]
MLRGIHRTIVGRLLLVWLLLSAAGGGLVFYLQTERIDRRVLKLALDESAALTAACAEYARRPDARRYEDLVRRSEEHVREHFVVVELYDAGRRPMLEAVRRGGGDISRKTHERLHRFPLGGKPRYSRFFLDGRLLLQVMVPLLDDQGALIAYFEAVYQVDDETLRRIKQDVLWSLVLLVAAVLAATVALYPVILMLNRAQSLLADELLEANLELMDVLGCAAAERDSETSAHNYRVTLYAASLGETLGLDDKRVRDLIAGAFLHDVGKIGVRDDVLLKPSALDADETEAMHGHVMKGVAIIGRAKWLRGARAVVEFHHEKFDGSGYPKGLTGAQIPLIARIFAVADVFDALASRRPYKEAIGLDQSLSIMREKRGSHFDPEVLDAFLIIAPVLYREVASATDAEAEEKLQRLVRRRFALE